MKASPVQVDGNLDKERSKLEELLLDPDFEALEAQTSSFNIFRALGVARRELRHSSFLAFLLDPSESHGAGDAFLRRLLNAVVRLPGAPPCSVVDIDLADLGATRVRREWASIDILVVASTLNVVIAIENKVDAKESEDQLGRYKARVRAAYSDHRHLLLFLTPEGEEPSDPDYVAVSYETVIATIKAVLASPRATIQPEVRVLVEHYVRLLENEIVVNAKSEFSDLCERIYKRHQEALELLFTYRPDQASEASAFVATLVKAEKTLVLDKQNRANIKFAPASWATHDPLNSCSEASWTNGSRMMLFQVQSTAGKGVQVKLSIGPGDATVREAIFKATQGDSTLFNGGKKVAGVGQTQVYTRHIAGADDLEGEYEKSIEKGWKAFLAEDLPKLEKAVADIVGKLANPS